MSRRALAAALPWIAMAIAAPSHAGSTSTAQVAQALITEFDYEGARRALADADPADSELSIERARLALHQLDFDGAVAILGSPDVQAVAGGDQLNDVARGGQRATAAVVQDRDEARGIEVEWQDEHDRALAPLLFDTVVQARESLTRDLGVDWPLPTRIVVVRDLLSLSAVTGLPYEGARTTGTVAVAKWGRVTLLSPRASPHGYPWRDTLAHELSHLAVTRATRNRAPLWLQEGVAKRQEVRWREPGPFDFRPSPEAIVMHGREQGISYPLDNLGPSIALLPSADAATIAFAEVTSFVRFYVDNAGEEALPRLLHALHEGADADQAMASTTGTGLKAWEGRWRSYLTSLPHQALPTPFGLGTEHERPEVMRQRRDRSRLAELLLSRNYADEAIKELDALHEDPRKTADASTRWLWAQALEQAGHAAQAEPLVADPGEVVSSYGPWWAIRGKWARSKGDEPEAARSLFEAVAVDPFDPSCACDGEAALCEAARAYAGPPYDTD
jgi:hypothetical protein